MKTILVFDFETTGLNPINDEIIEVGAVKYQRLDNDFKLIDELSLLVKTNRPIDENIERITGISPKMQEEFGVSQEEAFSRFSSMIDDNTIVVAYNIQFDLGFLISWYKRFEDANYIFSNDIMDVMEQEATEDFQIMAGMSPSEDAYLNTNVWILARHRLPWLLILMITATVTGRIMGVFEDVLASVVILSTFIPMLMDTGGNSGNQSSTLIIRGLATGEIKTSDWIKVIWKELRISLLVGVALSFINFLRLLYFEKIEFSISLTVSLTLIITVMSSKVVGGTLPLIAKKLKLDPAIMAGPLITTIVDALSLVVYFSIASALLGI